MTTKQKGLMGTWREREVLVEDASGSPVFIGQTWDEMGVAKCGRLIADEIEAFADEVGLGEGERLELVTEYGIQESRDMTDEEWKADALRRGSPVSLLTDKVGSDEGGGSPVERGGENRGLVMPDKEGNRGVVQVHEVGATWFVPTWDRMVDLQRLRAGECLVIITESEFLRVAREEERGPRRRFPDVEGLDVWSQTCRR